MSSRAVFALLTLFIVLDVLDTSNAPATLPLPEVLSSVKAKADLIQQSSFNSSLHRDSEQPHRQEFTTKTQLPSSKANTLQHPFI
ncbi:hypothetical protein BCR33DRAFT_194053 [Rhizoclosmatium globosum]|uniref:Uncharacterized protein n=1 Tax=Rhizoclosmatium globosum TaxID=329046 RepID=A0A1Y2CEA9_9FUNG|nr:hypothetical protein BCR33DRAFT_194053 [Rhizoclosmatium globosum]|eukprot:ORY45144.1 hypothetical protein BCR33DRAFT_194053 [Rhizoclosmatium globosum]